MQCYTRQFTSKILRIPLVGHYNYHTKGAKNKSNMQEQKDQGLICSHWEEAIIKENRTPDIPMDLMQKETIDQVNKNHDKNDKQQSKFNRK
jgi:hypothetical protein